MQRMKCLKFFFSSYIFDWTIGSFSKTELSVPRSNKIHFTSYSQDFVCFFVVFQIGSHLVALAALELTM